MTIHNLYSLKNDLMNFYNLKSIHLNNIGYVFEFCTNYLSLITLALTDSHSILLSKFSIELDSVKFQLYYGDDDIDDDINVTNSIFNCILDIINVI